MLTPYHLGPGLFFAKYFNFFAIMIGSVILDLEPFYNLFIKKSYPLHGFFHSFLGGVVGAIFTVLLILPFRKRLKKWSNKHLKQSFKLSFLFISAILGCWLHVLFDSFINTDVAPFWPLKSNPFLGLISFKLTYSIGIIMGIFGVLVLVISSLLRRETN
ncbi:MAG: metal-dependent hydrolase [Minisyncoccales bacterium]